MVAKELQDGLREITMAGFGLILICHSKEKATLYTDSEGNSIVSVEPDLSRNVYTICNAVCDLIAYINEEFDSNGRPQRWLYTRQTPTIFAGSRWQYLDTKIPFGYQELVNAIDRAIKKQAELEGATVVDHIDTSSEFNSSRSFEDVMEEARVCWTQYFDSAANDEEKEQRLNILKDIIKRVFGTGEFKLSQAVPSQQDLVECVIDEVKNLM